MRYHIYEILDNKRLNKKIIKVEVKVKQVGSVETQTSDQLTVIALVRYRIYDQSSRIRPAHIITRPVCVCALI
jgi:hypothetical protein